MANADFDGFLEELVEKEKKNMELASANYNQWRYHFELLKRNFAETDRLFGEIEAKIPLWKKEGAFVFSTTIIIPGVEYMALAHQYCSRNDNTPINRKGYYFQTRLDKSNIRDEQIYGGISISLGSSTEGISDEGHLMAKPSEFAPSIELVGLDKVKEAGLLTPNNTQRMLGEISEKQLLFDVKWNSFNKGKEATQINVGVGFLYDNNLADVAKKLFMAINNDGCKEKDIKQIIPSGPYQMRTIAEDDNLLVQDNDPRWRNE